MNGRYKRLFLYFVKTHSSITFLVDVGAVTFDLSGVLPVDGVSGDIKMALARFFLCGTLPISSSLSSSETGSRT